MRLETDEENIRDLAPTGVRIPSKLKSMLKEKAKANNRSMNAEIVARLEASFLTDTRQLDLSVQSLINIVEERVLKKVSKANDTTEKYKLSIQLSDQEREVLNQITKRNGLSDEECLQVMMSAGLAEEALKKAK